MKKMITAVMVCVYLCAAAAGVSAENGADIDSWLSVGVGISFMYAPENGAMGSYTYKGSNINDNLYLSVIDYSGSAFVDIKYAELTLGLSSGSVDVRRTYEMPNDYRSYYSSGSLKSFDISLLGKYPIQHPFNPACYFSPLLGLEYQAVYSIEDNKTGEKISNPGDFSMLWFQAGLGIQSNFGEYLFITIQSLYGIRLPTKLENDWKESIESELSGSAEFNVNHRTKVYIMFGWKL